MRNLKLPTEFAKSVGLLLQGFKKRFPALPEVIRLNGTDTTAAEVHARLASILQTHEAVDQARAALQGAVRRRQDAQAKDRAYHDWVVVFLKNRLGENIAKLGEFGVELPKAPRKLTSDEQLIAIKRRRETLRLRQAGGATEAGPR